MEAQERFLTALTNSIEKNDFVKIVLGKYRGTDATLKSVFARPILLKSVAHLSFTYRFQTRDITKNLPISESLILVKKLLGNEFKSAHLFMHTENMQVEFNKKGICTLGVSKPTATEKPALEHNHEKQRIIDPARPFLLELGVTDAQTEIIPAMSRKWKQINQFLEIIKRSLALAEYVAEGQLDIVDFGCGKGYLTFAVHDYLRLACSLDAKVTGIEVRNDLVDFCNGVAKKIHCNKLSFSEGDIAGYTGGKVDIVIALHACDTATDKAIHTGIVNNASIIICSPCCHKELRPQMKIPAVLEPLLKHGIHMAQEAEMITDALRALLLEANGYDTQIFEFVGLEHTSKNKAILAIKRKTSIDREPILKQIAALKEFYGITEQHLEKLLHAPRS